MTATILQHFCGVIEGVQIYKENLFYSVEYLLEQIEEYFGKCYTKKFIEDLAYSMEKAYFGWEHFQWSEFEQGISFQGKHFETLHFQYLGFDRYFEELNQNLQAGLYTNIRK